MTNVLIATRSTDEALYDLSGALINLPFERKRLVGLDADEYFYRLVELDAEWVINLDEDVFLSDPQKILGLLSFMKKSGYVCCGVPDGGVISIRYHNPLVPNAFFCILNITEIRKRFDLEAIKRTSFSDRLKQQTPFHLLKNEAYAYDEFEPYYPFFFWILSWGKILYLDAVQWIRDQTTTIATDHQKQPFLFHCWYARDYENQKQRFHHAFEFCKQIQAKKNLA